MPNRILALGGVAAPVLFSLVALVAATFRPGYSHLRDFISELGASGTPHAGFMNYAGFVPVGLMFVAFAVALARVLPRERLTTVAVVLVTLFGSGVVSSGVVSCDPGCPQVGGSVENLIHNSIGPISFLCLIVAASILGIRFRRLAAWRHLSVYSLLTGAIALGFLVALASSVETRELTGVWQRLLLATLFVWCIVVGIRAFRYDQP